MAKASRYETPRSANLDVDAMAKALLPLTRRIEELKSFDPNTVQRELDPHAAALEQKVNSTLQGILGVDTLEYNDYTISITPGSFGGYTRPSISEIAEGYRKRIEASVLRLSTLKELFEEKISDSSGAGATSSGGKEKNQNTRRVFVVHGHDNGTKEMVARFLSKLRLEPIILHERSNEGRTIIEKFEGLSEVDFAVVICTPDDLGYEVNAPPNPRPRARQNVIFELGFFIGKLGRQRVCVLYTGDIELPSDYQGVIYTPIDQNGAWRFAVASEMKSVGISIDMNELA